MLDHKRTATDIDEFTADALSQMFNELDSSGQGQYKMEIEPEIIERASKYYTTMAAIWVEDCNLVDYVSIVEERKDCDRWLHKTTKVHLMDTLYSVLIKSREKELLNKLKEFGSVVDEGNEAGCVQSYGSKINSLEDILASWLHYQGLLERCFSYKSQNATIENGESDGMDQSSTGLSAVSDNCSSLVDRYEIDPQITQATRLGFKYVISHHVDFVKKLVDHWDNVLVSGIDVDKRLRQCCDLLELSEENTCFSQCYKYKLAARLLYETSSLQKEQLSLSMLEPCIPSEEAAQLRRMIKEATEARSTKAHDKIKLISKANWPSLRELELDSRKLICDLVQASAVLLFTEDSMPVDDLASGLGVNKDAAISIIKPLVDKGVLRLAVCDRHKMVTGCRVMTQWN
ncbi:uncharacterized protein BXIN_1249 [Babesia sp. Xinjiang]|uniref:uncharacterized protein n=1 Tax=Babesia sp. Xinjiang TaxID=462227 RepID=UPI000A2498D2|nr:uncharacterized protein BXIN_1249 [Babesia sp. Xinjiang]ORM40006.1 hypothetical protein BXIN_1249 [Babesia sp. Xinjiang]